MTESSISALLRKTPVNASEVFCCLAFLNDPPAWTDTVSEKLTGEHEELHRAVRVHLRVPNYDLGQKLSASRAGPFRFYFVVLRPRKGDLVTLTLPDIVNGEPCRRLSHDEHRHLSGWLIFHRFWTLYKDHLAEAIAKGEDDFVQSCFNTLAALLDLPQSETADAEAAMKTLFDQHGKLAALGDRGCDLDTSLRLYRLCKELSTKYYIVL